MRRSIAWGIFGAVVAVGVGAGTLALRTEPLRFPRFPAGIEPLAMSVLVTAGPIPGSPPGLKPPAPVWDEETASARALVVRAGGRYRFSAQDPKDDPKGETFRGRPIGGWGAALGAFEGTVYTAPLVPDRGGAAYDLLTRYTDEGPISLPVRVVPNGAGAGDALAADAAFSDAPPRPAPMGPPGVERVTVGGPFHLLPLPSGARPDPLRDERALVGEGGSYAISLTPQDPDSEARTAYRLTPLDAGERPATCALAPPKGEGAGPGGLPAAVAKGDREGLRSARAGFSFAPPADQLVTPHPVSAWLEARFGHRVAFLPPRHHAGAVVLWRGLLVSDVWRPVSRAGRKAGWRYLGTTFEGVQGSGRKCATEELARFLTLPADGRPGEMFREGALAARGGVARGGIGRGGSR